MKVHVSRQTTLTVTYLDSVPPVPCGTLVANRSTYKTSCYQSKCSKCRPLVLFIRHCWSEVAPDCCMVWSALCSSMSLTRQSTSGVDGCALAWELLCDTSNICFDNMNSLLRTGVNVLDGYDVAIGLLYKNFIFNAVTYLPLLIVANFLKVTVRTS